MVFKEAQIAFSDPDLVRKWAAEGTFYYAGMYVCMVS